MYKPYKPYKPTLSNIAYQNIKDYISKANTDARISVRELAARMGIGYTPVREAFLKLQNEGFLRQVPGVGYFVEENSIHEIMHIFQVRECVEVYVMNAVFDNLDEAHFASMRALLEEQRRAFSDEDMITYSVVDIKFHSVALEVCGNKYFTGLLQNVRERFLLCSSQVARDHSHKGIDEHESILLSMESRDKEKTVELLKNHIIAAKERIREGYLMYVKNM